MRRLVNVCLVMLLCLVNAHAGRFDKEVEEAAKRTNEKYAEEIGRLTSVPILVDDIDKPIYIKSMRGTININSTPKPSFEIDPSKLRATTFWDGKDTYFCGLLSLIDYNNLFSIDLGVINAKHDGTLISLGIGVDLEQLMKVVKWNYRLPEPLVFGVSYAKDLNGSKDKFGVYAGIRLRLDKQ